MNSSYYFRMIGSLDIMKKSALELARLRTFTKFLYAV
jgi:hypothetical protein